MNGAAGWQKFLMILGVFLVIAAIIYTFFHLHQKVDTNPNACVNRTFNIGSSGNCVSDGQRLLNWYLYGIDGPNYMKITGVYGSVTQTAVKQAQKGASLNVTGKLDPPTWKLLCQGSDTPSWWNSASKNAGCP